MHAGNSCGGQHHPAAHPEGTTISKVTFCGEEEEELVVSGAAPPPGRGSSEADAQERAGTCESEEEGSPCCAMIAIAVSGIPSS